MFTTLMKWEWKATAFFLLTATAVFLLANLSFTLGFNILSSAWKLLFFVLAMVVAVVYGAGIFIYLIVEYYKTMYSRQGYFTHTLPVRGRTIVNVKLLYYLIITLVSSILAYAAIFLWIMAMALESDESGESLFEVVNQIMKVIGNSPGFTLTLVLLVLLSTVQSILMWQFVMTVGNHPAMQSIGKFFGPFLVFIIVQTLTQIVSVILAFLIPGTLDITATDSDGGFKFTVVFDGSIPLTKLLTSDAPAMPIGIFVSTIVIIVGLWYVTQRVVEKKLSLR